MNASAETDAYAMQIESMLMSKTQKPVEQTSSSSSSSTDSSTCSSSSSSAEEDPVLNKLFTNCKAKFTDARRNCLEFVEAGKTAKMHCMPCGKVHQYDLSCKNSADFENGLPVLHVGYNCRTSVGALRAVGLDNTDLLHPPEDINALLSECGELHTHWQRVFSQDCVTLDKSIWPPCSESLIRCLPSDSEHKIVFCKSRTQTDESLEQETYAELTTKLDATTDTSISSCMHGKSHVVVLQRLAWITRHEHDLTFYEDEFGLILSPITSATQCTLQGNLKQTALCTGVRMVIDISESTTVFTNPAISDDPVRTNAPYSAFSKWRNDAKTSVVEIPQSAWMKYFETDKCRLDEIPITNWWIVWSGSPIQNRLLKMGAVVPATVMFDLLQLACNASTLPTRLFMLQLSQELLGICCILETSDLKCLLHSWKESHMLSQHDSRYTAICNVYADIEVFGWELIKCRDGIGFANCNELATHHNNSLQATYDMPSSSTDTITDMLDCLQHSLSTVDKSSNFVLFTPSNPEAHAVSRSPKADSELCRLSNNVAITHMREFVQIAKEIRDSNRTYHTDCMKVLKDATVRIEKCGTAHTDRSAAILSTMQAEMRAAHKSIETIV